jgi:hypothetical protein
MIEKIQCPAENLSVTTFTDSAHNHSATTPNKNLEEQQSQ